MFLNRIIVASNRDLSQKHERKLQQLYGGKFFTKQKIDKVINLSNVDIEPILYTVFDLGMNYHLKTKVNKYRTKIELEKLNNSVTNSVQNNKLEFIDEERFKTEIKRYGLRGIQNFTKDLITKEQYEKIKSL